MMTTMMLRRLICQATKIIESQRVARLLSKIHTTPQLATYCGPNSNYVI